MTEEWSSDGKTTFASARLVPDAEECLECGAIIPLLARGRHREFHEELRAITEAQEKLNRATRSFVKLR